MRLFLPIFILLLTTQAFGQFTTPGTGVRWTLDSIVAHSPATMAVSGTEYQLLQGLTIAENDSLLLNQVLTLAIGDSIEIAVRGYFSSDAEEIIITSIDPEKPYKGFWFYDTSTGYFNNTLIENGGGIRVITPLFVMENCEVSNNHNDKGSATGGAVVFSNGSPIINKCIFRNNIHPALSSGANTSVALQLFDSYFEGNNQKNNNRPQINMGPSGTTDSTRIIGNVIIGDRDLTVVGGISVSSLVGVENRFVIMNNLVSDNRYGITTAGNSTGYIIGNIIENNNTETNPLVGGSGISLYNTNMVIISGNQIRNNLWGITLIDKTVANLGSDDPEDYNPGGNIFSNNGNEGQTYALYNNTENPVKALHNCWIEDHESNVEEVEAVIVHKADDEKLGEVTFDPFECGITNSVRAIENGKINIYPNPSSGIVHFNTRDAGFIQIYEISGHVLMHRKIVEETTLEIRLNPGIYFVKFEGKNSFSTGKLMIR
ncbi:MAG: T9SS type A sorting domain-containing protein [Saprospiraceae bacterium]